MLRGSLYIVAHPDDDLLFLSPDLIADVTKKSPEDCFTVVFVTSGDAGKGDQYAAGREKGIRTAYGNLIVCDGSGGSQDWNRSTGGEPDHPLDIFYFQCAPSYRLVFMRLPDGDYHGDGYAATCHETLTKLYYGDIHAISSTLVNVDNQATGYTLPMLKAALSSIISAVMPTRVRTMDWLGDTRVPKDHSDHYTVGKLVRDVMLDFKSISLIGYVGYAIATWPQTMNQSSSNFSSKAKAFFDYATEDKYECRDWQDCIDKGIGEPYWLLRQYHVEDAWA